MALILTHQLPMMTIIPSETPQRDMHQYLLGAVAPRPIAFASTVDADGNANLAPYSFFNAFSSNPPIVVFSSNRRSDDNTTKDTLHNIEQTMEVVINVVSHDIVQQMALASIDYPTGVSEFDKAGLTPVPSEDVRPFRVKESPVQMECKVQQIIALGDGPGAGHLIICHVVKMHLDERILDAQHRIDPHKIDLMGRMGRAFYTRASGAAIETIVQPVHVIGVGFDGLPDFIRHSPVLTGNEIAKIAALAALPTEAEVELFWKENPSFNAAASEEEAHLKARELLKDSRAADAAKILMRRI